VGLGDILDGAFRSIRFAPSVMFGLTAVVVVIAALVQTLPLYFADFFSTSYSTGAYADESLAQGLNLLLSYGVGLIFSFLATTVLSGMLTYAVSQGAIGQRVTIASSWRAIGGRVPRLIGLSLLVGLIVMGVVLVPIVLAVVGVTLMAAGSAGTLGAGLAVILVGIAVSLVALAWLGTRLLLAPAALVLEGQGVGASLRRGWRLSRGRFWRLFGIYLLTSLIVGFVSGVVSTPVTFVTAFALLSHPGLAAGGVVLGSALGSLLTTPFAAAVVALLYIDARIRSEGLDLALMRAAEDARP
jgi:hypothetical protein